MLAHLLTMTNTVQTPKTPNNNKFQVTGQREDRMGDW